MNNPVLRMFLCAILILLASQGVLGQYRNSYRSNVCEHRSCNPATGNLLNGREDRLAATSTCGLNTPSRYCIVSHLEDGKNQCFYCDSRLEYSPARHSLSHRIGNIISTFSRDWKQRWWQAENGREDVSIQLDLEAEFQFTHLIMRFKTFRPKSMLIERSYDFGKTWKVYQYFAFNCAQAFPGIPTGNRHQLSDVLCTDQYSRVEPSTEGEVVFSVLPPSIPISDPYSEEVQDLLKMTNLRVNFTSLHTLGDNLLDSREAIKEKYYYALYNMVVRGRCSCYGHASRCLPLDGQENNPKMVHGRCECTHNTKGLNCEQCEDFYNDLPWRPARRRETNACKKCECHNHATRCHFDPAVYEQTGRVSGGVCDDCQHNTRGRNCDECKPFFFQDPGRDLRDPSVCQPCDCDPFGSEHNGECESLSDPEHDLVAGRCLCKRFVEGTRCDRCVANYWQLDAGNPDGCKPCSCSQLGTIGNYGCDQQTGLCRCKRFVTGRTCDECLPEFFGLSDDDDGCNPCDCNLGGSTSNRCDQQTGQCECRPHMIGRRCDQPAPGYFVVDLDFLRYEAEYAIGSENTRQVIREPLPGREVSWTGPGFMRVTEADSLTFTIDNILVSMYYDIIIRYEPQMPETWADVRVTLERPGPVDQRGSCANSIPHEDKKSANLPQDKSVDDENEIGWQKRDHYRQFMDVQGKQHEVWQITNKIGAAARHYLVVPGSCLERGVNYKLRLDFISYRGGASSPNANILIDSIVLIPNIDSMELVAGEGLTERMKEEFKYYRCAEQQHAVIRGPTSDICLNLIITISSGIYERAFDCACDQTGSLSNVCNPQGGDCECKSNVIGRQCDQCSPGTYGFGPNGCQPCNCHSVGARNNLCNAETGQCECIPNAFGRECGSCRRGFYGFPSCQQCHCNGLSETCDDYGRCDACVEHRGGDNCEQCEYGYYGDPAPGSALGCRACMCPGGAGSGYQHGSTCRLDTRTNDVVCNCATGYAGNDCRRCAENYHGNPLMPGGSCVPCQCNGNIATDVPGSCNAANGECLKCLYHTEGFHCERCEANFFGDASIQNCQQCVCNILGTDRDAGHCDRETGQCPCLQNVVGQSCDRCAPNHWKIASGSGCEACACDPDGALSNQCNEFNGQCRCREGRGGRDCSECPDLYWGNPEVQCIPCDCDPDGSSTNQCDRQTGQCPCIEGVTGYKCDRCARGTTGNLPYCAPCGECFDNWDRIVTELREETNLLIEEGGAIKVGGAPGAFEKEFNYMEQKLQEVKDLLSGTNITDTDLDELRARLDSVRQNLTNSSEALTGLDGKLENSTKAVEIANNRVVNIRKGVDQLKKEAEELKANATNIRELDVSGAFNSTLESQRRSQEAQHRVDASDDVVYEAERLRVETEQLLDARKHHYDDQYEENEANLELIRDNVFDLETSIVDLNEMVCDGRGDPCDPLCGGAGCGHCGNALSCDAGAVAKANNAMDYAQKADTILMEKRADADDRLRRISDAEHTCDSAHDDAQMAHDEADRAKTESESVRADLQDLINRIMEFMGENGAKPADIRMVAEEVLAMRISLTPEEIQELAQQINETIKGLTDIDSILEATRDDLRRAQDLKDRADRAQTDADDVLLTAELVIEALVKAEKAQGLADTSIGKATQDINDADIDLNDIEAETNTGAEKSEQSLRKIEDLSDRMDSLKKTFTENENNVERATLEAIEAEKLAHRAEEDANRLEEKYSQVAEQLDQKYNQTKTVKDRADRLRDRASTLYNSTNDRINKLNVMQQEFSVNEKTLLDLSGEIQRLQILMVRYVDDIQRVAKCHRECSGGSLCI